MANFEGKFRTVICELFWCKSCSHKSCQQVFSRQVGNGVKQSSIFLRGRKFEGMNKERICSTIMQRNWTSDMLFLKMSLGCFLSGSSLLSSFSSLLFLQRENKNQIKLRIRIQIKLKKHNYILWLVEPLMIHQFKALIFDSNGLSQEQNSKNSGAKNCYYNFHLITLEFQRR